MRISIEKNNRSIEINVEILGATQEINKTILGFNAIKQDWYRNNDHYPPDSFW